MIFLNISGITVIVNLLNDDNVLSTVALAYMNGKVRILKAIKKHFD